MNDTESRQHILTPATAVFAEKGFAKASMNDIVRASGMSKGGVYWHFRSKDDMIAIIFDRFFQNQIEIIQTVLTGERTASEKLFHLVQSAAQDIAAAANQFPSPLEFYVLAAREDHLRSRLIYFFNTYRSHIIQLAHEGIASGDWAGSSAEEIANTIINLFEGCLMVWSLLPDQVKLSTQIETAVQLLLSGLQKQDSTAF